jgi:hypothetical protein
MKALIMAVVLTSTIILSGCTTQTPTGSSVDTIAQCLTDNDVVMYGTEWCGHCQNQKGAFGASFEKVNYVDCDQNREACNAAGIRGYPTWSIDGQLYPGEQEPGRLAQLAGCT